MPRRVQGAGRFTKGVICGIDPRDIEAEAASWSENIDPRSLGKLQGRPSDTLFQNSMGFLSGGEFLYRTDGKQDLVGYTTAGDIEQILDFYGNTPAATVAYAGYSATCVNIHNQAARLGASSNVPFWKGYLGHQAWGVDYPNIVGVNCEVVRPIPVTSGSQAAIRISSASIQTGGAGTISAGKVQYGISYVYDGYQEGPLFWSTDHVNDPYYEMDIPSDGCAVNVTLWSQATNGLSPRLTHAKLYRRDLPNTGAVTPFRLVKVFQCMTNTPEYDHDVPNGLVSGSGVQYHDDGTASTTFESETGFSINLRSTMVNYELSAALEGYLFVGKCRKAELPDASHMVFRSKPLRYDTFDWTTDFVVLPTIPTAMASFLGRLFVFDRTTIYRVNPQTLVIEDTTPYGVTDQRSVCVTETGIFFANRNGAYYFNGKEAARISDPIYKGGWEGNFNMDTSAPPVVRPFPTYNAVAFFVQRSSTGPGAVWLFTISEKRWDFWLLHTIATEDVPVTPTGAFLARNGSLYYSAEGGIRQLAADTTRQSWQWHSRNFGGESKQNKRFYVIRLQGTVETITQYFDDASNATGPSMMKYAKWVQVGLLGGPSDVVYGLEVVYRQMEGER